MDEVHKMGYKIIGNPKFIGLSASKAGWYHANQKIYTHEEELPTLKCHDIIVNNINNTIKNIKSPGPYLILADNKIKINVPYTLYDNTFKTLVKKLSPNEYLLLHPGPNSTGINLNDIKCIIFVYPIHHMNNTIIQSLGRVTRTTNFNNIELYNLHENKEDLIFNRSIVSENEIIKFCKKNDLFMIKNSRDKKYLLDIIKNLLLKYEYHKLLTMNKLYYTCLLRIQKKQFNILITMIASYLNTDVTNIKNIIK
jgi:hypothetical protein